MNQRRRLGAFKRQTERMRRDRLTYLISKQVGKTVLVNGVSAVPTASKQHMRRPGARRNSARINVVTTKLT